MELFTGGVEVAGGVEIGGEKARDEERLTLCNEAEITSTLEALFRRLFAFASLSIAKAHCCFDSS